MTHRESDLPEVKPEPGLRLGPVRPEPNLRLGLAIHPQPGPRFWVRRTEYAIEERGGHPFLAATDTRPVQVKLPLEVLPRVAELDLDSLDAILAFVGEYGPLKAWPERFAQMALGEKSGMPSSDAVRQLVGRRKRSALKDDSDRLYGEFVDEFRVGAAGLQALLLVTQELEADRFSYGRLARAWPASCPWSNRTLSTRGAGWAILLTLINEGLASTRLTVSVLTAGRRVDSVKTLGQMADEGLSLQVSGPFSLYGACLLELAQHLLEGREYRNCANESCGRLFSMQEGRSSRGRHRTDAMYCSRTCALAQAQREHRRRQASGEG